MFVVKVPGVNDLGNTAGCERAGNAIIKEFRNLQSNESGVLINSSSLDLEEIHLDNSDLKLTNNLISKNSFDAFEENSFVVFLGGDHSISFSIIDSFFNHCKNEQKNPCLVIFDAHANCEDLSEFPSNKDWFRRIVLGGFPTENILIIGLRNATKKELDFISEYGIKRIKQSSLLEDLDNIADTILEFCFEKEVYVSVGIDVVDPAFAPATDYPEVGGLTSQQILYLIQRLRKTKNLRGLEIVGINAEEDKNFNMITSKLGAKIVSELL